MKEAILIAGVFGVFFFGYFLMGHLDAFLGENRKSIEQAEKPKEPSCMLLTQDLSDEELTREIRAFRSKHQSMRIMLCDCVMPEGKKEDAAGRKV